MKKMKEIYEEDFFEGIFKHAVGEFTKEDLEFNKKWFYGWFRFIEKQISFKPGKDVKVLEIGCSIGAFAAILKEKKFNVYATDISKYAVKKAKKLVPGVHFGNLDISKPIKIQTKFDYIIGFEVIEHIQNPVQAIKNLKKKLSPGGYLILSSPPPFKRFKANPTHVSLKTEAEWNDLFKRVGFKEGNIICKKVTFIPMLWKFLPKFNFAFPFHFDLKKINSTTFYFLKNEN